MLMGKNMCTTPRDVRAACYRESPEPSYTQGSRRNIPRAYLDGRNK